MDKSLKQVIAAALLCGFTAFAPTVADDMAPTATPAEAALPFGEIPHLEKAYIDTSPADWEDGVPVGELGVDAGNKDVLVKLAQEIADGKHSTFDSLLIAHKGKLLFESYYLKGRVNLPHPQASATKAYTGLAIGRAIQLGYLTMADLDKPVVSFLKELDSDKFVEGAELVTLHQAMTMRSGLRVTREQREELEKDPSKMLGQRQVQSFLEVSEPVSEASQSFNYQGIDTVLAMQVLDAVVPGSAEEFIKNELLAKLGITNFGWRYDVSGFLTAPYGSSMTSRNMVKWGTLAANKGKWEGEQLIPEEYVEQALSKIVPMENDDIFFTTDKVTNPGYGYYWWHADMQVGDKTYSTISAQGGSGQMIILVEELDLMVVTTVHRLQSNVLQITAERILPAFE